MKRYLIRTSEIPGDSVVVQRATSGYLLLWEEDGAVLMEGALAPDLLRSWLKEAAAGALKDKLPGFLHVK